MSFGPPIPHPDTMRVGKEVYFDLPTGTAFHRIHRETFDADAFNGTPHGDARFSPIQDTAKRIIPTIYGGQTFECAVSEIILRCPDVPPSTPGTPAASPRVAYPADFRLHVHSALVTTVDLRLVDIRINSQRRIGVDHNALLACPSLAYPDTRGWAAKIHAACPTAQGLYYESYQYGPEFAFVLFGDRVPPGALSSTGSRRVAERPCHDEIVQLATALNMDYEDL